MISYNNNRLWKNGFPIFPHTNSSTYSSILGTRPVWCIRTPSLKTPTQVCQFCILVIYEKVDHIPRPPNPFSSTLLKCLWQETDFSGVMGLSFFSSTDSKLRDFLGKCQKSPTGSIPIFIVFQCGQGPCKMYWIFYLFKYCMVADDQLFGTDWMDNLFTMSRLSIVCKYYLKFKYWVNIHV